MNDENVKFEGKLALNLRERSEMHMRMLGLRRSLRDLLDPILPVESLEMEMIATQALDLANLQVKYRELLKVAETIRQYLHREK